jgi:hypothetical protein
MKLRFAITKRQLYVETLLRVKFHNSIQCYLEINREKKLYLQRRLLMRKFYQSDN